MQVYTILLLRALVQLLPLRPQAGCHDRLPVRTSTTVLLIVQAVVRTSFWIDPASVGIIEPIPTQRCRQLGCNEPEKPEN